MLLLNLLIAMFSYRFNHIQENTDLIWKFQLYELVAEYRESFAFPPPISLISYAIACLNFIIFRSFPYTSNFLMDLKNTSKTFEYAISLERQFASEYLINKRIDERELIESRLKSANDKLEMLDRKINEIIKNKSKE